MKAFVLALAACGPHAVADDDDDVGDGGVDATDANPDGPGTTPGSPWTFVSDATGIQRIERYHANLFEGVGGYYIIGSCTGADDNNNVTSQGSDGHTLRAPGSCPGAPFSLTITGTNPYHVKIQIGPLPVAYRTLSVPLDPNKDYFDRFQFAGTSYQVGCGTSFTTRSGSGATFDSIPRPCTIPNVGSVGVARVVPLPAWGEISGPLGTIRRTITAGNAQELAFINHPGTNNIEIGFNSNFATTLAAGSILTLEEDITLADAAVTPPTTRHDVETLAWGHQVGRLEIDGWSADTNLDPAGFMAFGPYISLSPGAFQADFRLLVDNNNADNLVVARIEARDSTANQILAQRDLRRTDFTSAATYQDFALPLSSAGNGHRIEFRTYWHDRSYVRQDRLTLHWPN
jgi:hypothetical protein